MPETNRTDTEPLNLFRNRRFKELCNKRLINHVECRMSAENSKIKKMQKRTVETKKRILLGYHCSVLRVVKQLFAMRMNLSQTGKSPYEKYTGVELKSIKKTVMNRKRSNSDIPEFQLTLIDFDW